MQRLLARIIIVIVLALATSDVALTQQAPQTPPANAPRAPNAGAGTAQPGAAAPTMPRGANEPAKQPTGVVRGYVTAAIGGRPLYAAQIRLISAAPAIPGGNVVTVRENRAVASEPDGRFEFKDVPAGRYRISASKTGYVTFEYGQRAWNQPGTQIEVADTQTIDHIDFALQRGGVIVVTALNGHAEPLAGAQVTALQWGYLNGRRQLMPGMSGETNDRGEVRLHGLSPGDYYVSANAPFGNIGAANEKVSYVTTYYPGTLVTQDAQRVRVNVAEETTVSIPMMRGRLATISGRAMKSDGTPLISATPGAVPTGPNQASNVLVLRQEMPGGGAIQRNLTTKPDGSFSVPNLLPGTYELQVRTFGSLALMPRGAAEFAQVPVTVNGADITNLTITSQPGANITGQMVFDTGSPPTDKPVQDFRFGGYYTTVDQPLSPGATTLNPDFSFETRSIALTGNLRLTLADTGWNVKEEIVDGKDIVEVPMTFEPGREYKDVRVVLTQKRAEVNGGAIDAAGRPVQNFVALLFPQDRERWVPRSLSILVSRSDQNGQFKIQRIPAVPKYASYYIIALDSLAPDAHYDFELLARLAPLADKITLGEIEVKPMTLKVQDVR